MKRRRDGEVEAPGRVVYLCQECGYESAKWLGRCPACERWSTLVEEPAGSPVRSGARVREAPPGSPTPIAEVTLDASRKKNASDPPVCTGVGIADLTIGGQAGKQEVMKAQVSGKESYDLNPMRKAKALAISGGHTNVTAPTK